MIETRKKIWRWLICRPHIAQFPAFYFIFIRDTSLRSLPTGSLVSSHLHVFHLFRFPGIIGRSCTTTTTTNPCRLRCRFGLSFHLESYSFIYLDFPLSVWPHKGFNKMRLFLVELATFLNSKEKRILLNPCGILAWFIVQIYCIFFFLDVTCQGSNKSSFCLQLCCVLLVSPRFWIDVYSPASQSAIRCV